MPHVGHTQKLLVGVGVETTSEWGLKLEAKVKYIKAGDAENALAGTHTTKCVRVSTKRHREARVAAELSATRLTGKWPRFCQQLRTQ